MGLAELRGPLRSQPVRRVWLSQLVSLVGDMTAWVAANVLVYERTRSALAVAVLNAVSLVAWLGPAQVLVAAVARFPRLRVMIGSDIVRAALFGLLALPLPLPAFMAIYFAAACGAPIFECTRSALMVDITRPEGLAPAIGLLNTTMQAGNILGFALGGVLVAVVGAQWMMVINAGTFVFSALMLRGIVVRGDCAVSVASLAAVGRSGVRDGVQTLRRDAVVRRCLVIVPLVALSTAAAENLTVVFADRQLHAGGGVWVGVLAAALPVGALLGLALVRLRQSQAGLMRTCLRVCLVLSALVVALAPVARWAPLGLLLYMVLGAMQLILVPTSALVTPRRPSAGRAAAWSVLRGVVRLAEVVGTVAAGVLAASFTPGVALTVCAVPVAVVALVFLGRPLPSRRYELAAEVAVVPA